MLTRTFEPGFWSPSQFESVVDADERFSIGRSVDARAPRVADGAAGATFSREQRREAQAAGNLARR